MCHTSMVLQCGVARATGNRARSLRRRRFGLMRWGLCLVGRTGVHVLPLPHVTAVGEGPRRRVPEDPMACKRPADPRLRRQRRHRRTCCRCDHGRADSFPIGDACPVLSPCSPGGHQVDEVIMYIPDELMLSPAWCLANIPQLAELFKQDPFTRHSDYVRGSPQARTVSGTAATWLRLSYRAPVR